MRPKTKKELSDDIANSRFLLDCLKARRQDNDFSLVEKRIGILEKLVAQLPDEEDIYEQPYNVLQR